jgi:hypothetical protein
MYIDFKKFTSTLEKGVFKSAFSSTLSYCWGLIDDKNEWLYHITYDVKTRQLKIIVDQK